jgi:hypothetical protein
MKPADAHHFACTEIRAPAFASLFGDAPIETFSATHFEPEGRGDIVIDVLVYELAVAERSPIAVSVTNGMSDQRMAEGDDPEQPRRRELIQYLPRCTPGHARRLRDMAWLPHFDGFLLDTHHSLAWQWPAVEGTPWKNAFFLEPLVHAHREFSITIDGDPVTFLWHIPLSDEEREFKRTHGSNALIDRMDEIELPWIFDEENRPPLVD